MSSRKERLCQIADLLEGSREPVSGTYLAESTGVSRQAIVQDIATLRENGLPIVATSQGYHIERLQSMARRVLAVRHGAEDLYRELSLIVSLGGRIVDVFIDHPVYGELRGNINVGTPEELSRFLTLMETTGKRPLLTLSDGFHLHTIEAANEETLNSIENGLKEADFLVLF